MEKMRIRVNIKVTEGVGARVGVRLMGSEAGQNLVSSLRRDAESSNPCQGSIKSVRNLDDHADFSDLMTCLGIGNRFIRKMFADQRVLLRDEKQNLKQWIDELISRYYGNYVPLRESRSRRPNVLVILQNRYNPKQTILTIRIYSTNGHWWSVHNEISSHQRTCKCL
jgi:hypothetical protein